MTTNQSKSFQKQYQRLQRELIGGIVALGGVFVLGILWYCLIEKWSWIDAAYMTMITLSTVGFDETHPLDEKSRLFTIFIILLGVITIGYIVNRITEALIQGYFQQHLRLKRERSLIETLENHYIISGFGRIGRQIALEFASEEIPFIVIDSEEERVELAKNQGYIVIQGDATLDSCLMAAKIDRATCLVTALRSDADNLYTVLSAKTLNPKIRAIARASTEEAVQKLQRAGADAVVSPYITGGKRIAAAAIRPQVMDFVDGILTGTGGSFYLEEFLIDPEICPCIGQSLSEASLRSKTGALVLAIRRVDGTLIAGPTGDTLLLANDSLTCMGTPDQLRQLNRLLGPIRSPVMRLPKRF
jgi:voltage-gated potassium channel